MPRLSTVMTATPVAGKLLPQLDAYGFLPSALLPNGLPDVTWNVARFVPVGEVLTSSNCNAALIAAEAAAYAETATNGIAITVPAGTFTLDTTVRLRGRASGKRAPYVVGQGVGATYFEVPTLPTGGTHSGAGVCFWLDGSHTANYPIVGGGLFGFTLQMTGDHGATGVYGEHLTHSALRDIEVIGYGAGPAYSTVTSQTGAAASCGAADSNGLQTWTGLTGMTKDCEGRVLVTTGAATGANNGTFLIVSYVSATSVKVINASGTSDASNGALTWTEKYMSAGFRFRGDYTNSRGVAVTNNQDVRTDNLRSYGMGIGGWFESCTQWTSTHLKLENNGRNVLLGHNCDIFTVNGGLFQGVTTYVVEEIPGKAGGRHVTLRDCYQEGAATAWLKTYPPSSGVADYVLENCHQGNSTTYLSLSGTRSVIVKNPGGQVAPTYWVNAVNCDHISLTGGVFETFVGSSKYVLDLRSREGFSVVGARKPYSGQRGDQKNLNKFLIGRGDLMAEIWDARASRLRTVNGTPALTQLTGLINAINLVPENAGIYPSWQASNSAFGGRPTWTNTVGAAAAAGSLKATMTLGALPVGSQPGVLAVFRLTSASTVGAGKYQMLQWTDGTNYMQVGGADEVDSNQYYANTYPLNPTPALGATTVTTAQAIYGGLAYDHDSALVYLAADTGELTAGTGPSYAAFASAAAGTFRVFGPAGGTGEVVNAVEIAWVGLTKRGLTQGEKEQALDLMCSEFELARY